MYITTVGYDNQFDEKKESPVNFSSNIRSHNRVVVERDGGDAKLLSDIS